MGKRGIKPSVNVGDVFVCADGEVMVSEYHHSSTVTVRFKDGTEITTQAVHLRRGAFSNPNARTVHGVGYLGQGRYAPKQGYRNSRSYTVWLGMMARCYKESVVAKHPTYRGCSVEDSWHNYQAFAEWYEREFEGRDEWEIDKDLLVKGNKVYCEELCIALPQELNCLLTNSKASRSIYVGVTLRQKVTPRYVARCSTVEKKDVYLGMHATPEEAFLAYKTFKESYIKQQANKWKDHIDPRAYHSLMTYSVQITD